MLSYRVFVDAINEYAENGQWFWVASMAKECLPALRNHLDEIHEVAREAVEHYIEEENSIK